jgi:hypothetical protein
MYARALAVAASIPEIIHGDNVFIVQQRVLKIPAQSGIE